MSAPNGIPGAEAASRNEHLAIVVPCYNAGARMSTTPTPNHGPNANAVHLVPWLISPVTFGVRRLDAALQTASNTSLHFRIRVLSTPFRKVDDE